MFIVGVDGSVGVQSQTDPLPVILRITGPVRSVVQSGCVLTTKLEGCIVDGAARGDLSAEKIYVNLAKITCDQSGECVTVSKVKGFGGKTGVWGRVSPARAGSSAILPDFAVVSASIANDTTTNVLRSTVPSSCCPGCGTKVVGFTAITGVTSPTCS